MASKGIDEDYPLCWTRQMPMLWKLKAAIPSEAEQDRIFQEVLDAKR